MINIRASNNLEVLLTNGVWLSIGTHTKRVTVKNKACYRAVLTTVEGEVVVNGRVNHSAALTAFQEAINDALRKKLIDYDSVFSMDEFYDGVPLVSGSKGKDAWVPTIVNRFLSLTHP